LNSFASYCNRTFSVGVLNLNNMRDEASDRKVGKNTLVVKIGGKKAKLYHYFLVTLQWL
jgi:1,4-dihydroxy-2-naphthoate octaprenyltransferase